MIGLMFMRWTFENIACATLLIVGIALLYWLFITIANLMR